ncbi:hypothetical protein VBY02_004522 [Salmonella enterica]|nr:hypothetical protein [Salmonella enterica]
MSHNLAKMILNKLNENIVVIGKTGTGKSTLILNAKIPDSKYFDFVELTKNDNPPSSPHFLCEENYLHFEPDLLNTPEKTIILDYVCFPLNLQDSRLMHLIDTIRKHDKRLIIVAYPEPEYADMSLFRYGEKFGAIIQLDKDGDYFICDVEMKGVK